MMPLVQSLASSLPHCSFQRLVSSNVMVNLRIRRSMVSPTCALARRDHDQAVTVQRRSANYQPTLWSYDYLQSITSDPLEAMHKIRAEKLKEEIRMMIGQVVNPLEQLKLIDVLEKLGLSYHFVNEIEMMLTTIHCNNHSSTRDKSLHEVALEFRLLRQHDNDVSQDVFTSFMDERSGNFKSYIRMDIKGILSLYEASYVSVEGEGILEKARDFTTKHLEGLVNDYYKHDNKDDESQEVSVKNIRRALEFPQHWRSRGVESRWFIDAYAKRHDKNLVLLELAELEFDVVKAIHQDDSLINYSCL